MSDERDLSTIESLIRYGVADEEITTEQRDRLLGALRSLAADRGRWRYVRARLLNVRGFLHMRGVPLKQPPALASAEEFDRAVDALRGANP